MTRGNSYPQHVRRKIYVCVILIARPDKTLINEIHGKHEMEPFFFSSTDLPTLISYGVSKIVVPDQEINIGVDRVEDRETIHHPSRDMATKGIPTMNKQYSA